MNGVCEDDLIPHILPQYRETFREMWASASAVTRRFCGVRDPFREFRRIFLNGGRNLGKSFVTENTEQQNKQEKMQTFGSKNCPTLKE